MEGIAQFRDGKLTYEHIYWDQASVLKQAGLLTDAMLLVFGAETACKVPDPRFERDASGRQTRGIGVRLGWLLVDGNRHQEQEHNFAPSLNAFPTQERSEVSQAVNHIAGARAPGHGSSAPILYVKMILRPFPAKCRGAGHP